MASLAPVPLGCLYRQRTGMLLSLVSSRLLRTICSTSFYRAMAAAVGPAPLRAMAMVTLPQVARGEHRHCRCAERGYYRSGFRQCGCCWWCWWCWCWWCQCPWR